MKNFVANMGDFSRLVVLPHSVFALPFALSAYFFALRRGAETIGPLGEGGWGEFFRVLCIALAVISARTAAMAFNRLIDAEIDAENPRTKNREIPQGRVSKKAALVLVLGATGIFLLLTAVLGMHCLILSPVVLIVLFGYSLTKRYSPYSHLYLGAALGIAPAAAWWVLRPHVEVTPLLLLAAVLLWVAGFDILYSCQDVLFDRAKGLFSIPAEVGIERALTISTFLHVLCLFCFILVGWMEGLGRIYLLGMGCFGAVLLGQHRLVTSHNLQRINQAFFLANGFLSLFYVFLAALLVFGLPSF